MKKKLTTLFIIGFMYSLNASNYKFELGKQIYKDRINVVPVIIEPVVVVEEEIIYEESFYDGVNLSNPGWVNISHYCGISANIDRVSIHHGAGTCTRELDIEGLTFNADNNIDISFNVRRISYGSNYYARFYITGFFDWYYHRSYPDWIRYGYDEDGSNKQIGNAHTAYRNYRITYSKNVLRYYNDGNLVEEIENFTLKTRVNSAIRASANNARVHIENLKIKISKDI
jgi:hypothetical protein